MTKKFSIQFAAMFFFAFWSGCQEENGEPDDRENATKIDADFALVHATVIDTTGAPLRSNMTIGVKEDRIVCFRKDDKCQFKDRTKLFDIKNKYVIPGLFDMHVHNDPSISPSVYIANGVTLVREMSGSPFVLEWREQAEEGTLLGPRFVVGSPMIDGSPSLWENTPASHHSIDNEDAARDIVRQMKQDGYDFIKIYSRLSEEVYAALAEEANVQNIPFAGHDPDDVPMSEASRLGQRSFEHLFGLAVAVSDDETAHREKIRQIEIDTSGFTGYPSWFDQMFPIAWDAAQHYSEVKAKALFSQFVKDGSAQVPTLASMKIVYMPSQVDYNDERAKYFPSSMVEGWNWQIEEIYKAGLTEDKRAQRRDLFDQTLYLVGELHKAGVRILAGTDCATPYVFHGFSLHDELELLVTAGLTPLEALQAATIEPARFLGLENVMGTIGEGRVSDLVVLNENPLDDIRNTREIFAVVARGRFISSSERLQILETLEGTNQ